MNDFPTERQYNSRYLYIVGQSIYTIKQMLSSLELSLRRDKDYIIVTSDHILRGRPGGVLWLAYGWRDKIRPITLEYAKLCGMIIIEWED